jgi:prephenate dehydratase
MKEELARQELEKLRESREKRRAFKAVRQESHELALTRAQKAEEYRLNKLKESIKNKEDRTMAIRKGFRLLGQMRNTMKDIMVKTNVELKVDL